MPIDIDRLVARIAAAFDTSEVPSEGAVVAALVQDGFPEREADMAVKLVQLAGGRTLLNGLGIRFSDEYLCFDASGRTIEQGRLSQHPVYVTALERLRSTPRALSTLSMTSSEVQTVSKRLHKGLRPWELVTAPTVLFVEAPTEAGLAVARATLDNAVREIQGRAS